MELSSSIIFSKESFSYFLQNGKPRKNSLYFRKRNFFIFQETSYFSGSNFPSSKSKKKRLLKSFLHFGK